jgi:two-component system, LytTR family, response regulator
MIQALILDDEMPSRENLMMMLEKHCPEIEVVAVAENIEQGLKILSNPNHNIDVAFLDVNLPDGLVFQLLGALEEINFNIIFVSAFQQFAIRAFRYSAIDYIPKPIDAEILRDSVAKIRPSTRENQTKGRLEVLKETINNPGAFEKMSVSALDGIYFVSIKDIVRLEAEDNYTHLFLQNGDKITASKTIKMYEELLLPRNFFRIHKSHIINVNFMRKFVKGDGGYVTMDDTKKIEVSRRRRPLFLEHLRKVHNEI